VRRVQLEHEADEFLALVPSIAAKRIADIIRKVDSKDDEVTLAVNQNQLMVAALGATCVTRLLDGRFPDYGRILPKRWDTRAMVDVAEAQSAVKLASFFAKASTNLLTLTVSFDTTAEAGSTLTLATTATEIGDNQGSVRVIEAIGQYGQISFDATTWPTRSRSCRRGTWCLTTRTARSITCRGGRYVEGAGGDGNPPAQFCCRWVSWLFLACHPVLCSAESG
jgi:hypothetical protein